MEFEFLIKDESYAAVLERQGDRHRFSWGGQSWEVDIVPFSSHGFSVLLDDGRSVQVFAVREGDRTFVSCRGQTFELKTPEEDGDSFQGGAGRSSESELQIKAPMPGKVIKIDVEEGDEVRKNQTLAVVEAMKMENEIKASLEAVVQKIHAAPGDLVDTDTLIIELAPKD
jgi:biotin carboxyl carrier protein